MNGEYPNPAAIVYPTTMPPRFACQLTTRDMGRGYPIHDHNAWLDTRGDGVTGMDAGHYHRVRGGRVLPDPSDGHTHQLTMLPCGASGVRPVTREDGMMYGFGDPQQPVANRIAANPYADMPQAQLALMLATRDADYTKLKMSYTRVALLAASLGVLSVALGIAHMVRK